MSEGTIEVPRHERTLVATPFIVEGLRALDQTVIIDPENDTLLREEVQKAVHRMDSPTDDDGKKFGNKNEETQPLFRLMNYITTEHPVLKTYSRQYEMDDAGDFVPNVNHVGGGQESSAFKNGQAESLGPLIAKKGDMCYGQSLIVSVVLDQKGIENSVIQLPATSEEGADHAYVSIKSKEYDDNIIFDPMFGTIIYQKAHSADYNFLYGEGITPKATIKGSNQRVIID